MAYMLSFYNRIKTPQYATVVISILIIVCSFMQEVIRFAGDYNASVGLFYLPHLFNNIHFAFFYGIIVCFAFSDAPFIKDESLFVLFRTGRKKWCIFTILSLFSQSILLYFVVVIAFLSVSFPVMSFDNKWGALIHTLCYKNVSDQYAIIATADKNIEINYSPWYALLLSSALLIMVTFLFSLIQLTTSVLMGKRFMIIVSIVLCLITYVDDYINSMEYLYYLSPLNWFRLSKANLSFNYNHNYPSGELMIFLICIMCVILSFAFIHKMKDKDLEFDSDL